RSLSEALVSSVSAMKEVEASNRYVRNLVGPMAHYIADMCSKGNLKAVAQQPDIILMISLSVSTSLLNEAKSEKYKDLRALLQLLTHLCSKDLVDFSLASPEEESTNIAEYFELLSHMLEVYPEKVAELNMEAFKHILETLDFGIHRQDTDVVDMCLRAINALASYRYREMTMGKKGIGAHGVGVHGPDGKLQEGFLAHFLHLLLELLLFGDFSMELAGSAADALLPLVLCEQDLYQLKSGKDIHICSVIFSDRRSGLGAVAATGYLGEQLVVVRQG
ncbi:hypothetical protein Taro_019699, partial [Colocasia esculenta]|nr:hypothetical protein [Colocasia esculenta]